MQKKRVVLLSGEVSVTMQSMNTNFSRWFRSELEKRKLSHEDAARQTGISRPAVTSWATGRRHPLPKNCIRIAKLLDLDTDDVLVRAGYRVPRQPVSETTPAGHLHTMIDRIDWSLDQNAGLVHAILVGILQAALEAQQLPETQRDAIVNWRQTGNSRHDVSNLDADNAVDDSQPEHKPAHAP